VSRFKRSRKVPFSPLEIPAELLLIATTVAAIMGLDRVFDDRSFFGPLLLTALLAHGTLILFRRLGVGLTISSLVSAVVVVLQLTWSNYSDTTNWIFPSRATFEALDLDLEIAWGSFGDLVPPVSALTGYLVVAGAAVWLIAVLADWAAFRLGSGPEAVLPGATLVIFVAIFGVEEGRVQWTLLYVLTALAFVLAHRAALEAVNGRWLRAPDAARGYRAVLVSGSFAAVLALSLGALAGPAIPGVDEDALLDWEALDDGGTGGGSRVVVSPLVDIRGRLVEQADVEVFSVRTEEPAYWRLTSLDVFDGAVWTSKADYSEADGSLPSLVQSGTETVEANQEFTIEALAAVWLPAAYEPRAFGTEADVGVGYEPKSSTLIVNSDFDSSDGLTYAVRSAMPRYDRATLEALPDDVPPEIADRYLDLPDDFSPEAQRIAEEETAGATGPYEKAYDLQWYFQNNFEYSLDVQVGHSSNRIEDFLASGVGYCEQFAGSFAAMARSIGLPSRVAVGFTQGERDPDEPGVFRVRGEHAHAWPEVYIEGAGWVAFEPTPGRGAPGAVNYTDLAVQQETSGSDTTAIPLDQTTPSTLSDQAQAEDGLEDLPENDVNAAAPGGDDGASNQWLPAALVALAILIGLGVLYAYALPKVKRRRRLKISGAELDPARERVEEIWDETVDTMAAAGVDLDRSETPNEFARRAAGAVDVNRDSMRTLGALTTTSRYASDSPTSEDIRRAEDASATVRGEVDSKLSWWARKRHELDPRPLVDSAKRD
jgi:transglutaminase-like putative cysteine protease